MMVPYDQGNCNRSWDGWVDKFSINRVGIDSEIHTFGLVSIDSKSLIWKMKTAIVFSIVCLAFASAGLVGKKFIY